VGPLAGTLTTTKVLLREYITKLQSRAAKVELVELLSDANFDPEVRNRAKLAGRAPRVEPGAQEGTTKQERSPARTGVRKRDEQSCSAPECGNN
jgi:hypothetical protein